MEQNKISRRNFLRVAGASATAAAMGGGPSAAAGIKTLWSIDLQILATSDTHGKFDPWDYAANKADASGSVAQQATAIKENRTKTTLVVDAGDTIQANSAELFLNDDVHPMIAAMNAIGYDIWTSPATMSTTTAWTRWKRSWPAESQGADRQRLRPGGKPLADGYTIIKKGGVKIGVIGMVTPNIIRWDAKNLEGWTVTNPVDESRKIIDKIKRCGCPDRRHAHGYRERVRRLWLRRHRSGKCLPRVRRHRGRPRPQEHPQHDDQQRAGGGEQERRCHCLRHPVYLERQLNGKWKVKDRTSENLIIKDYAPDPELTALLAEYDQRAKDDAVTPIGQLVGGNLAPENEIDCLPQAMVQDTALLDFINKVQMYYTDAQVAATALTSMTSQMRKGTIRVRHGEHLHLPEHPVQAADERPAAASVHGVVCCLLQDLGAGHVTIAFDSSVRYYLYDAFEGVNYDLDVSKEPGNRIKNLKWPDGRPGEGRRHLCCGCEQLPCHHPAADLCGHLHRKAQLPKLLEIDVRGDAGGVRELLGEYIRTVKGGTIEPHVNNNWKIVGNNWNAADHEKAVQLHCAKASWP